MKSKRIEKLESGFLSPTGEFFPCSYMAHITVADELLETLCPDKYFDDPEEQLRKLGWVDVHMEITSRKYNVCWNYYGHMSSEQVRVLRPLIEDAPEKIADDWKLEALMREFER